MSTEDFGLGFDCAPSFYGGGGCQQTGERSVKVEQSGPKGNLDRFPGRLNAVPQNEGKMDAEDRCCIF